MNRQQRRAAERNGQDPSTDAAATMALVDMARATLAPDELVQGSLSSVALEILRALRALVESPELALTPEQQAVAEQVGDAYLERWLDERGVRLPGLADAKAILARHGLDS